MSIPPTFRPSVELLEQRETPTGIQAYVTAGNLYVLGTPSNDFITVNQINNQISVPGAQISVRGIGTASINASSISKVVVYGNGGGDFINLATLQTNADIYGSSGDDYIRCGTGNDIVYNGGGFDWIYHPFNPNQPLVNGEAVTDFRQGIAPVCQTGAALAAAVQQGYNFSADIHYLGNQNYQVKLHGNLPTQIVHFDGWTTSEDPVTANGEFWPILMQRARLQAFGIDPTQDYTPAQWDALNLKTSGRLYSIGEALYDYTGIYPSFIANTAANPRTLQANLAQGDYVVAQSRSGGPYVSADGVIGNHAYAVLAVYFEDNTWKVRLYNPWGMDRENGSTLDSLDKSHPAANDGIITLTWAQFTNSLNFKGYFVAAK